METFDKATLDSTGTWLVGLLEAYDPKINAPLSSVTFTRDVTLRTNVALEDESHSFTVDSFNSKQSNTGGFIGANTSTVGEVGLDSKKITLSMAPWAKRASWTNIELVRGQRLGRPVDLTKVEALNLDFQMTADKAFYLGNPAIQGAKGLLNNSDVSSAAAPNGSWAAATAAEMIADVQDIIARAYKSSGYAVCPSDILLSQKDLGLLSSTLVSSAGNQSVLSYLRTNTLATQVNGRELNIKAVKWCDSEANSSSNLMLAYTNDPQYVQFALVPLQRQPLHQMDISQSVSYVGSIGNVEWRFPETASISTGL
jgi:hypothetical protein